MIEELPEDSRYRRVRESSWTTLETLVAINANIGHGMREDYRNRFGLDYDYEPLEPPKLPHEVEENETETELRRKKSRVAHDTISAMMRGEMRMADINPTDLIEEVPHV